MENHLHHPNTTLTLEADPPEKFIISAEPISSRYIKVTELGKTRDDPGWISDLKILGIKQ